METTKFDIADYLESNEMISEYLNAVLEEGNEADIVDAIGNVAKSIGIFPLEDKSKLFPLPHKHHIT